MFEYGRVPVALSDRIAELQQRVRRMEGSGLTRSLPVLPALDGLVRLQTGTVCAVDSLSLVLALLAGPSRAGEWSAVVGMPDLGWEAAQEVGLDLARTVAVPGPGEHWLSVAAGLVEVASVIAIRPPGRVSEQQAARLVARLRQRDCALVVCGSWPRAQTRLSTVASQWQGLGAGHGFLRSRRLRVSAGSIAGPSRSQDLWFPDLDRQLRPAEPLEAPYETGYEPAHEALQVVAG